MTDLLLKLTAIYAEDGVKDLPSGSRSQFARAIKAERQAGVTTPEAEAFLAKAVEMEAEAKS